MVESTLAWLNRCRRLGKDRESLNHKARAFLLMASIRVMVRRLGRAWDVSGPTLIIAYRELRQLDAEALQEIHADVLERLKGGTAELNVSSFSKIDGSNRA